MPGDIVLITKGSGKEAPFPLDLRPQGAGTARLGPCRTPSQPGPEDRSWAVLCIAPESRPDPSLPVLGRAPWLCSQSPESSGFLIITNAQCHRIALLCVKTPRVAIAMVTQRRRLTPAALLGMGGSCCAVACGC